MQYSKILSTISLLQIFAIQSSHAEIILSSPLFGTLSGSIAKTAWTSKPIYQFLGVKYARSPTGPLRFQKPVLAIPWPGYHNVQQRSRRCPYWLYIQGLPTEELEQDLEDCLRLNVYSTNLTASNAVMVYVHGGQFDKLSDDQLHPILLLERNVVLVTLKYRLGALGLLSTESPEIPGNVALADIVTALQWVQVCARLFGGDPTRVTLFGHSSGAAMVSAIVFNPSVPSNLFHRGMVLSGSSLGAWSFDDNPLRHARNVASFTNCTAIASVPELNECFQNISVPALMEAYNDNYRKLIKKCIVPCGGSKFMTNDILPLPPSELLRNRSSIRNIPLMMTVVTHDAVSILGKEIYSRLMDRYGLDNETFNTYKLIDFIITYSGINDSTGTLKGLFSHSLFENQEIVGGNFLEMLPGIIDISNILLIKAPLFKSMRYQAGLYSNQTYAYALEYLGEFSYGADYDYEYQPFRDGVQHGDELIYTFAQPDYTTKLNERDKRFSEIIVDLWTSFAITGVPKSKGVFKWPPMTDFAGPYLHLNDYSWIGDNFLDELMTVTRSAHCASSSVYYFSVQYYVVLVLCIFKFGM